MVDQTSRWAEWGFSEECQQNFSTHICELGIRCSQDADPPLTPLLANSQTEDLLSDNGLINVKCLRCYRHQSA